ncbi:hypothetical protein BDV93DRAFT_201618 [Ceratobasidium sp. AG-I]|nr:hypothetical protein BDV93DRAFT_201618 [Ceratobasidium sp. AG-I]
MGYGICERCQVKQRKTKQEIRGAEGDTANRETKHPAGYPENKETTTAEQEQENTDNNHTTNRRSTLSPCSIHLNNGSPRSLHMYKALDESLQLPSARRLIVRIPRKRMTNCVPNLRRSSRNTRKRRRTIVQLIVAVSVRRFRRLAHARCTKARMGPREASHTRAG